MHAQAATSEGQQDGKKGAPSSACPSALFISGLQDRSTGWDSARLPPYGPVQVQVLPVIGAPTVSPCREAFKVSIWGLTIENDCGGPTHHGIYHA
jgi:hypothetical protein